MRSGGILRSLPPISVRMREGSRMQALSVISQEHANLWRLTVAIDRVVEGLREPADVDAAFFKAAFDYLEHFVDRVHHPKEDDYLFPRLRRRDGQAASLIDRLESEHRAGPGQLMGLRARLAACADPRAEADAVEAFVVAMRGYTAGIRAHVQVEEKDLLPLARVTLDVTDWTAVDAAFCANDDPLFGSASRAEYRELFHRLVNLAPEAVGLGGRSTATGAPSDDLLLRVSGLRSAYGRIEALKGIDLEVRRGEVVALVGANGAGKTTFLRALSGIQPISAGSVVFDGEDIARLRPDQRVRRGICQSPEGRQVFGPLSIEDNLRLGAYTQPKGQVDGDLDRIFEMFPVLAEKRRLPAGTLSGGQQQMLAIGRALMGRPKLLLLDEPSMGLAPLLVEEVFNVVRSLRSRGITILLVEQNAFAALNLADRGYVMQTGSISLTGTGAELLASDEVRAAYLGM